VSYKNRAKTINKQHSLRVLETVLGETKIGYNLYFLIAINLSARKQ
jgi:hypothetical protein